MAARPSSVAGRKPPRRTAVKNSAPARTTTTNTRARANLGPRWNRIRAKVAMATPTRAAVGRSRPEPPDDPVGPAGGPSWTPAAGPPGVGRRGARLGAGAAPERVSEGAGRGDPGAVGRAGRAGSLWMEIGSS